MKEPTEIGSFFCRLLLLFIAVPSWSTAGDTAGSGGCQGCHIGVSILTSAHGALTCKDCHIGFDIIPHPKHVLPHHSQHAVCSRCHNGAAVALESSVHGKFAVCQDCHGIAHRISSKTELVAGVSPQRQISTCGRCHGFTPGLIEGYLSGAHARALLKSG